MGEGVEQRVNVAKILAHEDYDSSNINNDICLLKVSPQIIELCFAKNGIWIGGLESALTILPTVPQQLLTSAKISQ